MRVRGSGSGGGKVNVRPTVPLRFPLPQITDTAACHAIAGCPALVKLELERTLVTDITAEAVAMRLGSQITNLNFGYVEI